MSGRFVFPLLLPFCCSLAAADEPAVDYVRDIKPLFAKHCAECHGAKQQKSGLRADTAAALITGGDTGPAVVVGQPDESLLIQALTGKEGVAKMPPKGEPLSADEIALISSWIKQGAKAPTDEIAESAAKKTSNHWAFQPVVRHAPPAVKHADLVINEIDAFLFAKLEEAGLSPSVRTERGTLIRRVTLDLTGLLPTPEEVEAFINDPAPDAYDRLVDRLLASPHYGERWGRRWLDQARYADSNGFTRDMPRNIWPYRDWVIDALNRDLPFDEFTIEQVAGDMLPEATLAQRVATGFHRNTLINEEGGTDPEQFRVEAVVDRVGTTGQVFLGLTVGCAQCHDHKYDPVTQREFYQLYAFLNNAEFDPKDPYQPKLDVPDSLQIARGAVERKSEIKAQVAKLDEQFKGESYATFAVEREAWVKALTEDQKKALPFNVNNAVSLPERDRSEQHKRDLDAWYKALPEPRKKYPLLEQIAQLKTAEPTFPDTMVMVERPEPRETFVQLRGDFLRLGAKVQPGVPEVLPPLPNEGRAYNRLDLARWLVDAKNPLTPRVIVNRLWLGYFGRGLVETDNDFGTQGSPPSHPELLDWLASEFIAHGWSLKRLHRLIVTSHAYQQSSQLRPDLEEVDPINRLLGRQSRIRLDAELVRDAALSASGLLTEKLGGASVYPPQPEGVFDFTQDKKPWKAAEGEDRFRRGMYTYLWRSSPYPAMTVFDFPDANVACTRRNRSNTPLQSLTLANDLTFVEFAQGLARRIVRESGTLDDAQRLRYAFRVCFAREPSAEEQTRLRTTLESQREAFLADRVAAEQFLGKAPPSDIPAAELAGWTALARVLLNVDEFITRE